MKHGVIGILVFLPVWVMGPSVADAAMWRCLRPDGSEFYTNKKESVGDCKEYVPQSVLGVLPEEKEAVAPIPETGPYPIPPRERTDERRLTGNISFETFRMLSTGMTETEILVRAGPPRHRFRLSLGTVIWAYTNDDWIIEVTFSGGRAADINRYRPRP